MTGAGSYASSVGLRGSEEEDVMRRETGPFIKTASRGSVYMTQGGGYYLKREGARWVLLQRAGSWEVIGRYGSMAEAVSDFRASGR